jgi:hypothetical protein
MTAQVRCSNIRHGRLASDTNEGLTKTYTRWVRRITHGAGLQSKHRHRASRLVFQTPNGHSMLVKVNERRQSSCLLRRALRDKPACGGRPLFTRTCLKDPGKRTCRCPNNWARPAPGSLRPGKVQAAVIANQNQMLRGSKDLDMRAGSVNTLDSAREDPLKPMYTADSRWTEPGTSAPHVRDVEVIHRSTGRAQTFRRQARQLYQASRTQSER